MTDWATEQIQRIHGDVVTRWMNEFLEAEGVNGTGDPPDTTRERGEGFFSVTAMSADGSTLVVGAPHDAELTADSGLLPLSDLGTGEDGVPVSYIDGLIQFIPIGAAFVYTWLEGAYVGGTKLLPDGATGGAGFGTSVACSGDGSVIVVGAPSAGRTASAAADGIDGDDGTDWSGAAFVYTWNGVSYDMQRILPEISIPTTGGFGAGVSITEDGSRIFVGAFDMYEFELVGGTWTQTSVWTPDFGAHGYTHGINSDGTRMAIGKPGTLTHGDTGYVVVFELQSGEWTALAQLVDTSAFAGSDAQNPDRIGDWNAISEDGNVVTSSQTRLVIFEKLPEQTWADVVQTVRCDQTGFGTNENPFGIVYHANIRGSGVTSTISRDGFLVLAGQSQVPDSFGSISAFTRNGLADWETRVDQFTPESIGVASVGFPAPSMMADRSRFAYGGPTDGGIRPDGVGHHQDFLGSVWVHSATARLGRFSVSFDGIELG